MCAAPCTPSCHPYQTKQDGPHWESLDGIWPTHAVFLAPTPTLQDLPIDHILRSADAATVRPHGFRLRLLLTDAFFAQFPERHEGELRDLRRVTGHPPFSDQSRLARPSARDELWPTHAIYAPMDPEPCGRGRPVFDLYFARADGSLVVLRCYYHALEEQRVLADQLRDELDRALNPAETRCRRLEDEEATTRQLRLERDRARSSVERTLPKQHTLDESDDEADPHYRRANKYVKPGGRTSFVMDWLLFAKEDVARHDERHLARGGTDDLRDLGNAAAEQGRRSMRMIAVIQDGLVLSPHRAIDATRLPTCPGGAGRGRSREPV